MLVCHSGCYAWFDFVFDVVSGFVTFVRDELDILLWF